MLAEASLEARRYAGLAETIAQRAMTLCVARKARRGSSRSTSLLALDPADHLVELLERL